jgi:elongation factor Ts
VGRTPEFHDFAYNIAMHIAAMNPLCIRREDVLPEVLDREKDIYRTQALESGKPEKVVEKIIQGRIEKFYQEACLLEQAYVKNQDLTVQDYLNELIAKMGEKTDIRRFMRFQLGESAA